MHHQDPFDRYHFVISYELLQLIEWLIEYEQENLKKLIKNAVSAGGALPAMHTHQYDEQKSEELQQNIVEFFALLDTLLHEVTHEQGDQDMIERALVPAINNIDTRMYDSDNVSLSLAKATEAVGKATGASPKEVLCRELLKRWKPVSKKACIN